MFRPNAYRTHHCGALRKPNVGETVTLSGWIHRKRDHGGLLFVDLRDHYGITQLVVEPEAPVFSEMERLRAETVIKVSGAVVARSDETVNANLPTGEIEVRIDALHLLGASEELPLPVFGEPDYPEDIRMRYRFLDLRRDTLHRNIVLRTQVTSAFRQAMESRGFMEFQTPILTASSPEGARDFLVPSRLHPGQFYALPQAPQIFKQLVQVAGFDRYFQIAPCFRDEDARADRSAGEFYQVDVEMSFVEQDDVFEAVGGATHDVLKTFAGDRAVTPHPFPHLTYADSMLRYGTDKPDLRIPTVIADVTALFARDDVEFKAFKAAIESGGVVRAIPAKQVGDKPRSFFDKLNDWARRDMQAPGLGYVVFEEGEGGLTGKGPIAKFLPEPVIQAMAETAGCTAGDALFFAAGKEKDAAKLAGAARLKLGEELDLITPNIFNLCWIVDFPLYEMDDETGAIEFSHNPFSAPQGGLEALQTQDPLTVQGFQYDLVCNGYELGSGAIRNAKPEVMLKAFEIAGYEADTVRANFSGLFNAFRYGAPPHGGIALGLDRVVMLLAGVHNIREVTLFPMTQQAQDLMMGAPSTPEPDQLKELHIAVRMPLQEKKDG